MKCYFKLNDEWIKGFVTTSNCVTVFFVNGDSSISFELTGRPEIQIHGGGLTITGFMLTDGRYDSVSIDVRPGWTKPK